MLSNMPKNNTLTTNHCIKENKTLKPKRSHSSAVIKKKNILIQDIVKQPNNDTLKKQKKIQNKKIKKNLICNAFSIFQKNKNLMQEV